MDERHDATTMNEENPFIDTHSDESVPPPPLEAAASIAEPGTPFEQIDSRSITLGRISRLIFAVVVACGIVVGLLILWLTNGLDVTFGITAAAGLCLVLLLFVGAFIWPVWEYKCTSWRLNEIGLEIHYGVFWQHRISVPVARVQHADVSQGPLQRRFELGKLTVHTAGTQNASVELNGIAHSVAVELRNKIVSQRRSSDVV